jgi:C4-dicarboxylate-specific signal transduction histidine kinase
MPGVDKAKETFARIVADGHRAGEVVGSVRAIFKSDPRTRTSLDINELISEALALERSDLRHHQIEVRLQPSTQQLAVHGSRVQLQQVLLNLITNAIHAMATEDTPRVLCVKSDTREGNLVIVSVADSGTGIEPQDTDRVFSPLFTTKSDGMGMGLSICRSIIQAHNGRLWVSRNTPRGSVFQFTLRAQNSASVQSSKPM